jgi:hypothetical protein
MRHRARRRGMTTRMGRTTFMMLVAMVLRQGQAWRYQRDRYRNNKSTQHVRFLSLSLVVNVLQP